MSHTNTKLPVLQFLVFATCTFFSAGCLPFAGIPEEEAAVAMIRNLGGKVEFDGTGQGRRVVKVYLHGTSVKNDDLTELAKLKKLKNLFLGKTQITDAGIVHLENLSELTTLSLNSTRVTDEGLKSLTKLTNLKTLNLQETLVTTIATAGLRKTLPSLTIAR